MGKLQMLEQENQFERMAEAEQVKEVRRLHRQLEAQEAEERANEAAMQREFEENIRCRRSSAERLRDLAEQSTELEHRLDRRSAEVSELREDEARLLKECDQTKSIAKGEIEALHRQLQAESKVQHLTVLETQQFTEELAQQRRSALAATEEVTFLRTLASKS